MPQSKELLVEELQDLLHAESQLLGALPKMASAAHNPKLREAFEKHLLQTEEQVERLKKVFELLGEEAQPKPCKAMMGLVEEGEETIEEGAEKEELAADLALIAAAQKVEHYEIAGYGTVRALARQIGAYEAARLLAQTLGEEEASDHLLTEIAKPIIQQATAEDWEVEEEVTA
jgi:Mn-containing catalase